MTDITKVVILSAIIGVMGAFLFVKVLADYILKEYFKMKSKFINSIEEEFNDGERLETRGGKKVQRKTEGGKIQTPRGG